jgi:N-acyl-D-amino-acid deacylase
MQRTQRTVLRAGALMAFVSSVYLCVLDAQATVFDVIVRGGTVIDGSGLPRYRADVGIVNGFIARVGDLSSANATTEIDATDLFVAPGFINIHSHASPDAVATAENMLTQGVTTEIVNPDGGGATDITRQLGETAASGLAENIGAYIGFNSAWAAVMGPADRRATPDDVERMRAVIADGLEHGAWGVSAGLDYKPAYFAQVEEVVRVVEPARKWRTNFPNHDRLTPESNYSSRAGVAETISIGEKAGLVPVVTHMKSQGREQGGAGTLLGMMDAATKRGDYTAADAYPYLAGQTGLGALMVPAWAQDGGRDATLKRFQDPALRARIVKEVEDAMNARFSGVDGVYLPATKRQLADIVRESGVSPGEAVVRILEQGNETAILKFGSEADLVRILQNPTTSMACDCGATLNTRQHPRAWGSFPRVLGRYVREQNVLTWEDAIRKMTALPANTIGMVDRGYLAPGMAADVAVFDPRTIVDRATYEDPAQLSEGVRFVLVNGVVQLRDGRVTGAHGGLLVTRSAHMPSRPMNPASAARKLSVKGSMEDKTRIEIDIAQPAGAPRAKGSVRIAAPAPQEVVDATVDLGVLQTTRDWESFTASGRLRPSGKAAALTVIVERADPFVDKHPRTVTIQVQGRPTLTGVLK